MPISRCSVLYPVRALVGIITATPDEIYASGLPARKITGYYGIQIRYRPNPVPAKWLI